MPQANLMSANMTSFGLLGSCQAGDSGASKVQYPFFTVPLSCFSLQVLGRIRGYADAAQEPRHFTTAPALAIPKALVAAGLSQSQIDFYEINEAFSVVDIINRRLLNLDSQR